MLTLKYPDTRHFLNRTWSPAQLTSGMLKRSKNFLSCFRMETARESDLKLIRWLPHHDLSFCPYRMKAL